MISDERRDSRISTMYMTIAAEFLERESVGQGLMTVTSVKISRDRKFVTLLFTVFPDKFQDSALSFAKRKRSEFRDYVKDKMKKLPFIPTFDFEIDLGEKNRQIIDSLVQKTK